MVPPPCDAVATWKKLLNEDPVEALPIFRTDAGMLTGVPAVALDIAGAYAVRSGKVQAPETVAFAPAEGEDPLELVATIV